MVEMSKTVEKLNAHIYNNDFKPFVMNINILNVFNYFYFFGQSQIFLDPS